MSGREIPAEFYRAAFEQCIHARIGIDDERRIVAANDAAAELFQSPLEALIGRSADDLTPTEPGVLVGRFARVWEILLAGGSVCEELEILAPGGQRRKIRVTGRRNIAPGLHLAMLEDITRNKEHELSSRRYELLRERAHEVIFFLGNHGLIVEANHAAEETYGYTRDELLSMNVRELRYDPTDFDERFRTALKEGIVFETLHKRKDGSVFPVEVASRPSKVGDDVLLSVIRDITERRSLHAKLLEADRLSTFGLVAAGLAHEINNPLAYVLTNHEVIARELPRLAAKAREAAQGDVDPIVVADGLVHCERMLSVAMEGLERVRSIVRDLKTFSRVDPAEEVLVDVHYVLDAAINVAQSELRNLARIERCYGEIAPVRGSTSRLGQVFINLVVNGAQAIPPEREGAGMVRVTTSTASDGWACIAVADDGVGISADAQRRLFEPFHTTKPGQGTGLGLYITKSIVEAHGGTIKLETTEGVGTTVYVKLPPYEPTLDRKRSGRISSTPP